MTPHWEAPQWDCDCTTTYTLNFDGSYQGKNHYMQNPSVNCSDSVMRFATTSVTINDTISIPFHSLNASAFEIPLMDYTFQLNDPVHIVVQHYGCNRPRMLNPEIH